MVRTRIREEQGEDIGFVSELEFNDFFADVVITGTENTTELVQNFQEYFPGQGLITAGSGIIVTTGTNFVQIDSTISGSGITEQRHELLDTLVHNLAENSTTEINRDFFGRITKVDIRTVPVTGTLIRSTTITRDVFGRVTQVVEDQHDETGSVLQTLTSTINRSGGMITSVDTVET